MAEPADSSELPQAIVVAPKRRRLSIVWVIPILAALVAIGIAVQRIRSEGKIITIVFPSAEGIEAGKTFIKYKDVNIGQVSAVQLTEDHSEVEVTARITQRSASLMVGDARFWVVRPTISLTGISGLNTLLSGNYIGFEAGTSENSQNEFIGLAAPPFVASQLGREFILKAEDLGSVSTSSPIYFRRLPVGQVISYGLAPDGTTIEIRVFIHAPYDKFVKPGTRFWKAGKVDVVVDGGGLDIRTESLVALLVGGVSFDTPAASTPDTTDAPQNTVFTLYADRAAAWKAPDAHARNYVLHFNESVRGLAVGAPVTLLGLPAGEVTGISLDPDVANASLRARVTIAFNPERSLAQADAGRKARSDGMLGGNDKGRNVFLQRLIDERGLRAQLKSGSLLTGQLYVALEYFPRAPKATINWNRDVPELPVVSSTLSDIENRLTSILDKMDKLPLEAMGQALKTDLEALGETLVSANKLITRVDAEVVPTLKADLDALNRALGSMERALQNADATLLGPNAPAQQELRDALTEFTRAARSMRVLVDYLERHPESPIRGKAATTNGGK
ncbi:MAG: MCE family protein [Betaproteobacteria bacterium]|nr:MCE family protein [Betaproteobacteria bacterium]